MEYVPHLYPVQLYLNTALMQSPTTISKTQMAIDYIRHFSILTRANNADIESGTHHITVVLTNNNLSETSQWKVRVNKKLDILNSMILSSRTDSDMKNTNQLWATMMKLSRPDELPDLILMCTHERRTHDLIDILKTLKKRRYDFSSIGIHRITVTIMFDEADKNMRLIVAFLKSIFQLLTLQDLMKDDIIRDIHFITATPLDDFWKDLNKAGVSKLKNIKKAIQSMDENSVLHIPYKELMVQYRWLNDHTRIHTILSMTKNPVEYASKVLTSWDNHASRIVFAPASITQSSHYEMVKLFQAHGYYVYVDNGDSKKAKGFYSPSGKFTSIEAFRKDHNITGEPYETFRAWREIHPTAPLAITGWLTIIRGITFNTIGFNFTDMILSAGHMNNLADLLQVSGRANGDVTYVNKFNIHCPKELWTTLDKRITIINEIQNKNPEEFEERDFRPKTKREKFEPAWTVPHVFKVTKEQFDGIKHVRNTPAYDIDTILPYITNEDVSAEIRRLKEHDGQLKIQKPKHSSTPTYNMLVTRFLEAHAQNKSIGININKKDKTRDGYRIHLDEVNYNIIVNFYYGSRVQLDKNESSDEDSDE